MIFLLACATQKPIPQDSGLQLDTEDSSSYDSSTDTAEEALPSDALLSDAGLCSPTGFRDNTSVGPFTDVVSPSPFGVGKLSEITLEPITQPDLIEYAPQSGSVDYTIDLGDAKFDIYVPEDYDGSEPYGLVGFINSGNNGNVKNGWETVLDDHQLIWIGAQDVGNAVYLDERMGKTIMGMWRMLELFNIDRSRFYVTGNSGGARTAQLLSWLHPRSIQGAFPLCGASYFREVSQEFETHEPDSHYEFSGSYYYPDIGSTPFAEWILDYKRPTALLTSSDDFRQGDILNIFHHGLQQDQFPTRYLEVGGSHCATDTEQAESAIGFMDHPMFEIVADNFSDGQLSTAPIGLGWADASGVGANISENSGLLLEPTSSEPALAVLRDLHHWNDLSGTILNATMQPTSSNTTISLWASDPNIKLEDIRNGQLSHHPGIHIDLTETELYVYASGLNGVLQPIFQGAHTSGGQALPIQAQFWSSGFQLDIGTKLTASGNDIATLGPDQELLHMRWSTLPSMWSEDSWTQENGAFLTIMARGEENTTIQDINIVDATGITCE